MSEIMDVACFKCEHYQSAVTADPCKSCDYLSYHHNFKPKAIKISG
jgi:hypothetical protein